MICIKGLTDEEVLKSREMYGNNKINIKDENKLIKIILESLGDPIIKIMLIALSIRFILMFKDADWYETLGMLLSILLSSLISSLSEYGSNKSFKRLQSEYESIMVRVKRNNKLISIKNEEVVVGDIVYLESGEVIPADGIIINGSIGVDLSSINGESNEVIKVKNDKLLKGSVCLSGRCELLIKSVGINTVYGDIAKELNERIPTSPLRLRLTKLAKIISRIGYIGAILVSISYIFNTLFISNNFDLNIIKYLLSSPKYILDLIIHTITLSVTIIIVCVPEGLPMMVALVLSSNMKRMLKNNVLVRKPVGIETSGSINVLLTDKTGTLTTGNLNVIGVVLGNNKKYNNLQEMKDNLKQEFIDALLYNNDSYYENNKIVGGNSTDKAILKILPIVNKKYDVIDKIDFNSNIKYSSVLLSNNQEYYKGASEVLINKCRYYIDENNNKQILSNKNSVLDLISNYTKRGIRVIMVVKNNILLGIVLIRDEIRSEAASTIKNLKDSGIHTIMITGDDKKTATSIADSLNMLDKNSIILTHDELSKLSDEYIIENYLNIKVIARALPKDKSRIAKVLENNGIVVGMTGDGVNDAPALKMANVGFAIGSGSEVAKEAADIIILDDNIKSIENAILYGRTIFKSIRKFIIFQLTMNLCALNLSIVGPFIGISSPVTVMQMLWINMIMDTLAGLAYSYEYPLKKYMKERPIKKCEPLLNKYMLITIITNSLYSCILLVLFLKLNIFKMFIRNDYIYYMTAFFSLFIFLSIMNAFNSRTERLNLFTGIIKNKIFLLIITFIFIAQIYIIYNGGNLFRTYGLTLNEFIFVLILSMTIIPVDLIKKIVLKFI